MILSKMISRKIQVELPHCVYAEGRLGGVMRSNQTLVRQLLQARAMVHFLWGLEVGTTDHTVPPPNYPSKSKR